MGLQVHLGRGEVHALAEASEGKRVGVMAAISQPAGDFPLTPASEPGATYQHVSRHLQDLLTVQCGNNGFINARYCT